MTEKLWKCNNCQEAVKPRYWHNRLGVVMVDIVLLLLAILFWGTIIIPIGIGIYYLLTMGRKLCGNCGSNSIYPVKVETNNK